MAAPPKQILQSVYFWTSLFLVSGLLFPFGLLLWIISAPFDRRKYLLHQFNSRWSDLILLINPQWRVKVTGLTNFEPGIPYVIVSNHQSGLDIIVLYKLHQHFKWIAKKELFAVPFIGWNMFLSGYIAIERGRGKSKLRMMDKAARTIREGNPVIIFPEGTRSPDGNLQPYKTGAFRLALETRSPILPVVIKGTRAAVKKGGLLISGNRNISISILEPAPYESFSTMEHKEIASMIYKMTHAALID